MLYCGIKCSWTTGMYWFYNQNAVDLTWSLL